MNRFTLSSLAALALAFGMSSSSALAYDNFRVAVYCRAYEVREMKDPAWLESRWQEISSQVHVDKVYLETHRDGVMPDDATIEAAKAFFAARGVETAGGITFTIDESNRFETFSYSNPEHRKRVQAIAEFTARHFDSFILDDFFFTSTKSEYDIKAKGDRSWTDYRLQLMAEAARDLVVGPAKKVNPKVKVVIKYPNWYEHFQALGFDLEKEPKIFDGIYTGTETRDAVLSAQHLQPYHGYSIMRYFENVAPGRNGGGWVDPFGSRSYDRYAEQLWLTLFARSGSQVTLFDWRSILTPLDSSGRGAWQDQPTSFDYEKMMQPIKLPSGATMAPKSQARAAGIAFEAVDKTIGALGHPLGLKSYRPFNSTGEDFLQSYLGMIGLPMEIETSFPEDAPVVLLTAEAAADPDIVAKIEHHVHAGNKVVITSGLLKALQNRGIQNIAEIEDTGRIAFVHTFQSGFTTAESDQPILIPQIGYRTNDSWELVSAIAGDNGWPLLHDASYADGHLYVLTVPENFADFYHYPEIALNAIRRILTPHLPVQLEGPSKVSLFVYDNDTFIVENFHDEPVDVTVAVGLKSKAIEDVNTGESLPTKERRSPAGWGRQPKQEAQVATFAIAPHSFRTFRVR